MELDQVVRQTEDQVFFKSILQRLRLGWMTEEDEARMRVLTLDDDNYTQQEIKDISQGALHLYATHQPKNAHNEEMLRKTVTEDNPLAVIKCKDETSSKNNNSISKHLNKTYNMRKTMLCRDAMVELSKTNIQPKWGLYNGTIGNVVDIIFREGENPNNKDLPLVVVVDFKPYRAPVWDTQNLTHVPIVPVQRRCEPMCCTRKQIPLQIAWAKTIHSIQGHNAGPTAANQSPNAIQRIIVHLGERKYEALNPGLTYVAISRATTIGCLGHMTTIPKKCLNSAIYFLGGSFPNGIKCLTHSNSSKEEYIRVKKRSAWVAHLDEQKKKTKQVSTSKEKTNIKNWLKNKLYTTRIVVSYQKPVLEEENSIYTTKQKKTSVHQTAEKNSSFNNSIKSHIPSTT